MITYQYLKSYDGSNSANAIKRSDEVFIPFDPDNTDYQAYLKWLEEGNTPLPADEQGASA